MNGDLSPNNSESLQDEVVKAIKHKTYTFNSKVREQVIEFLKNTDVFQNTENPEVMQDCIEQAIPNISLKYVNPKSYLYIQGQEDDVIYIIVKGNASLYMAKGEGDKLHMQKYAEQSQELQLILQSLNKLLQKHQNDMNKIKQKIYKQLSSQTSLYSSYESSFIGQQLEQSLPDQQKIDLEEFPEESQKINDINIEIKILKEKIESTEINLSRVNDILNKQIEMANIESQITNPHLLNKNLSQNKQKNQCLLKLVCTKGSQQIMGHHSIFLSNKRWQTVANSDSENQLILLKITGQAFIQSFEPVLQEVYFLFDILMNNFRIQKSIADNLAHAFQPPQTFSLKLPIFKEQQIGQHIFILKSGVVELVKKFKIFKEYKTQKEIEQINDINEISPKEYDIQEKQLSILKNQQIFGLESLLPTQNLRYCSAYSTTYNTCVLKIPYLEFSKILVNTSDQNNMRATSLDRLLQLEKIERDMQKFIPNCYIKKQSDFKNIAQVYKEQIKKSRQYTPISSLNLITNNKDYTVLSQNNIKTQKSNKNNEQLNNKEKIQQKLPSHLPTDRSEIQQSPANKKQKFLVSMSPVRKKKMSEEQFNKIHKQTQENLGVERKSIIALSTDMFQKQLKRQQSIAQLNGQYSSSCNNIDQEFQSNINNNNDSHSNAVRTSQDGLTPAQLADIKQEEKRIVQEQRKKNILLDFTQFPHLHKVGKFNNNSTMNLKQNSSQQNQKSKTDLHNQKMAQLSDEQSKMINKLSKELMSTKQIPNIISQSMSPLKQGRKQSLAPLDLKKSNKSELYYNESTMTTTRQVKVFQSDRQRNNSLVDLTKISNSSSRSAGKFNNSNEIKLGQLSQSDINKTKKNNPLLRPQQAFIDLGKYQVDGQPQQLNKKAMVSPQNKTERILPEIEIAQPRKRQSTANLSPLKPLVQENLKQQEQNKSIKREKMLKKKEKEIQNLEKKKKQQVEDQGTIVMSYQKKQELIQNRKHWLQQEQPFDSVYKQQYDLIFQNVKEDLKQKSKKQQNKPIF